MAQLVVSWFICDGRFRVHPIKAVGQRHAKITEIEDVDSGEHFHGSARKLERLFVTLGSSSVGEPTTFEKAPRDGGAKVKGVEYERESRLA